MITVSSFFSGTLSTVDAVIANFVMSVYAHFVQANAGLITLLFTLYIMFLGYQFLSHSHHFNLSVLMRRLMVMLGVYALVMKWDLYNLFVYQIFTQEPGNIAQVFIAATGKMQASGSITQAMDSLYAAVANVVAGFWSQVGFSGAGLAFIVYALVVWTIGTLLCVIALLLFIYAKMVMAVALALGPLFILFFLWEPTKPMFSAWLNKLITTALIPIVTSAILVLMLSVVNVTLPSIHQSPEQLQFYGLAPFLGLCLTTALILSQVLRICSSLGGGIALASISQGFSLGKAALDKSGATAAGQWAGRKALQSLQRGLRGRS